MNSGQRSTAFDFGRLARNVDLFGGARNRYLTTADFFEARFGTSLGTLYAIWGTLIFAVNMGTLLIGTGKIVDAVSLHTISPTWGIVGMTVAFLIYGTAGGLMATVFTESVQGLLIVVMSLMLVPFGLSKVGWFSGLHHSLGPQLFHLTGLEELSIWWILAGFTMNLINIVAQPQTMEVCSTGKSEFEGRIGFTYGNFVKRFCAIGWTLTGVIMAAMMAQGLVGKLVREDAFGTAVRTLLPAGFGLIGLMFAAILAAQMAALSAFMVAASALVSRNVYKKHINPAADEAQVLRVARVAGLAIVLLGLAFALYVKGVADALIWFWTLATFTGVFMWAGVLWRRTNATGAWASFFVMLAIWLVIGEPGQAVGQYLTKKDYSPASPATVARMTERAKPLNRFLLEVQSVKDGKTEHKDVIVQLSGNHPELGLALHQGAGGSSVVSVDEKGAAKQAGIKQGDVVQRCAKMGSLGIYADKKLLAYRLLAFLPAGILALIIGSLLGKPLPKEQLNKFYTLIKTPVGRESELVEQGIDVVYAGQSKGHPWELNHQKAVNVIGFLIALALSGLFFLLLYGLTRIGG